MSSSSSLLLIAGCYERFLFGFRCAADVEAPSIVRTFSYPAHKGAIKCIATSGSILASGGVDDLIHIYDVRKGRDLGYLMNPGNGAVTALAFHHAAAGPSHLLNGSSDGSISVWQAGSWDCLKTMEGHKGGVNSVAVHPNGSVALSVGRDRELRVWNLTKGKVTYHSKLAGEADLVAFHPTGTTYALMVGRAVTMHGLAGEGGQLADMPHPARLLSAAFCSGDGLLTGCEDGSLRLWDARCSRPVVEVLRAHNTRIKGVAAAGAASPTQGSDSSVAADAQLAATASSDGIVRLWDMRAAASDRMLAEVNTSARLTCLVHASLIAPQTVQSKRAVQLLQQPDGSDPASHESDSLFLQPLAAVNGQKQRQKHKQQQQTAQQPDQAQPKAKQKLKIKGKQRGERAAAPGDAAATAADTDQRADRRRERKQQAQVGVAPPHKGKKVGKQAAKAAAAVQPSGDRGVAKRGLIDFGVGDDDAQASADAPQRPKKHQKGAAKEDGSSKQRVKAQLQNLDRFD